jgi:hypothetical protein
LKPLLYQDLYSATADTVTLEAALKRHYELNPHFTPWQLYRSDEAKNLVRAHDITHLLFGCDTQLLGEMKVQLWAMFAVEKQSWSERIRYARDKESRVLIKNPIGYRRMLIFFIRNIREVRRVKAQAAGMSKKWRFFDEERHFQRTLGQIRAEYGIALWR